MINLNSTITEGVSTKLTGQIVDEDGTGIGSSSLTTLTLTLCVNGNLSRIINSRNQQNVLNTNNVTVNSSGNLVWQMTTTDNAIVDNVPTERHVAIFQWTYSSGTKTGKESIEFYVKE